MIFFSSYLIWPLAQRNDYEFKEEFSFLFNVKKWKAKTCSFPRLLYLTLYWTVETKHFQSCKGCFSVIKDSIFTFGGKWGPREADDSFPDFKCSYINTSRAHFMLPTIGNSLTEIWCNINSCVHLFYIITLSCANIIHGCWMLGLKITCDCPFYLNACVNLSLDCTYRWPI